MILYHGSYTEVAAPDIAHSRITVDFGSADICDMKGAKPYEC